MNFFSALFGKRDRPRVPAESQRAAIAHWCASEDAELNGPLATQRWVVLDVETTGLDIRRDHLLAIGAVLVDGATIRIDRSFEVVLRQATSSRVDNILIHRISGSEQLQGTDATDALIEFLGFAQKLPCVAFHALFDESMLKRTFAEQLGIEFSAPFIDLALLAPALVKGAPHNLRSLDDWVAHCDISISARHHAVADAVGTAQLFQILLSHAATKQVDSAKALFKLAHHQRWLERISPH